MRTRKAAVEAALHDIVIAVRPSPSQLQVIRSALDALDDASWGMGWDDGYAMGHAAGSWVTAGLELYPDPAPDREPPPAVLRAVAEYDEFYSGLPAPLPEGVSPQEQDDQHDKDDQDD